MHAIMLKAKVSDRMIICTYVHNAAQIAGLKPRFPYMAAASNQLSHISNTIALQVSPKTWRPDALKPGRFRAFHTLHTGTLWTTT